MKRLRFLARGNAELPEFDPGRCNSGSGEAGPPHSLTCPSKAVAGKRPAN